MPHRSKSRHASDIPGKSARALHELVDLLRAIIADHYITEAEAARLSDWIQKHNEVIDQWPVSVLAKRMKRVYADKRADEEERADLEALVETIVEQTKDEEFLFGGNSIPFTAPPPVVVFESTEFVFAGKLLYGSHRLCVTEVLARGGRVAEDVHHDTDYLVVGGMLPREWKESPLRHKILKAIDYRKVSPVHIISEEHWESYLWRIPPSPKSPAPGGWFPNS
jgi:NAD-dependent DNA ligase